MFFRAVFFVYGFALLVLTVCKSAEIFLPYIYQLERTLGGDKWMHFVLAFFLGLTLCAAFSRYWLKFFVPLVALILVLDELHQYFIATRRFEWWDTAFGLSGFLLAVIAFEILLLLKSQLLGKQNAR